MFNSDEMARISGLLDEGVTPDNIAKQLGISLSNLRSRVIQSGYRIVVRRTLEPITPVAIPTVTLQQEGCMT